MILELPKDIHHADTELLFPAENPIGIISPAKRGILLYGVNGKLAGQAFVNEREKNSMRISIADGGSVDVKKEGRTVTVRPSPLKGALKKNESDFFVFGDPDRFQYKLFVKKKGVVAPFEVASVAEHIFRPGFCYFNLAEDTENIFRNLLICLSINSL